MDLKTLWERTNDAINTIIRRDESTENGKLLQPCIEGMPIAKDVDISKHVVTMNLILLALCLK